MATRKKTRTLEQIQAEIARLQQEAAALRQAELGKVIANIVQAVKHYGLTAADLGLGPRVSSKVQQPAVKASMRGGTKRKPSKAVRPAKYRDEAGNSWVGHGKRPKWFVDALAAGKSAEDLLVT